MISWNNYIGGPGFNAENMIVFMNGNTQDNAPIALPFLGGLGKTAEVLAAESYMSAYYELMARYPIACVGILGVNSAGAFAFDCNGSATYESDETANGRYEQYINRLSDVIIPVPFNEAADYYELQTIAGGIYIKLDTGSASMSIAQFWAGPGVQCAARYTMSRGAGSQAQLDRGYSGAMYSAGVVSWREYDVELVCRTAEQWYRPGGLQDLQALGIGAEVVILPTGGASGTPHPSGAPLRTKRGRESLALHGRISAPLVATQIAAAENYTRVTFRVEECL